MNEVNISTGGGNPFWSTLTAHIMGASRCSAHTALTHASICKQIYPESYNKTLFWFTVRFICSSINVR